MGAICCPVRVFGTMCTIRRGGHGPSVYMWLLEKMVGATGIEPVTPTMSTQQSAAAWRSNQLTRLGYSCGCWYHRKNSSANDPAKSLVFSIGWPVIKPLMPLIFPNKVGVWGFCSWNLRIDLLNLLAKLPSLVQLILPKFSKVICRVTRHFSSSGFCRCLTHRLSRQRRRFWCVCCHRQHQQCWARKCQPAAVLLSAYHWPVLVWPKRNPCRCWGASTGAGCNSGTARDIVPDGNYNFSVSTAPACIFELQLEADNFIS